MWSGRLLLFVSFLLLLGGCMVSEQIGEPTGYGTGRIPSRELTIHFDTQFNRILLFGRSAGLVAIGLWVFSAWGKKAVAILFGVGFIAYAGWLLNDGYPTLTGYRVDVLDSGLHLKIPPEPEKKILWDSIEGMELEGYTWAQVGNPGTTMGPLGQQRRGVGVELPDWEKMEITVTGGQKHTLNLKLLSIEQREILSRAIVKQANLVKEK